MIRLSSCSLLVKVLALAAITSCIGLFCLSSCSSVPPEQRLIEQFLKSHYKGMSYQLLQVSEPDSAYSPLSCLLKMQHYIFNVNTDFEQQHQYIIRDDITNSAWSKDLYRLILDSDSLVHSFYKQGQQSMKLYRAADSKQAPANSKIIRASLVFNKDTLDSQFYFGQNNEIITHCLRTIESYETDLFREYARWLRLKANAQQDLENLSDYHFD